MIDARGFNGGMNGDAPLELLPQGDYTYAMNIENGERGVLNLYGNRLIEGAEASEGGKGWVCGAHFDKTRQRIIYFVHNWRSYHRILSYELPTEAFPDGRNLILFENGPTSDGNSSCFNWTVYPQFHPEGLIKDIKVVHRQFEGDLVYFIDPNKNLLKFNYDTLLQWREDDVNVEFDYFKVIKAPPKDVVSVDVIDDTSVMVNNLYKKLFQFRYRFVYDDGEKSVWSAISKVALPTRSTDPLYNSIGNTQNVIDLKFSTGDINVKKIEIAGRIAIESAWSDFFLIDTIDKGRDDVDSNTTKSYLFRNDGVYVPVDIQESNLLFDHVPDEVNALELANGNTLVVGGLKDGMDRLGKLDVAVTPITNTNSPAQLSTLSATTRNPSDSSSFAQIDINPSFLGTEDPKIAGLIKFSGTPQVGDVITVSIKGYNVEKWQTALGAEKQTRRNFDDKWIAVMLPGWGIQDLINYFIDHPNKYPSQAWWYHKVTMGNQTSTQCKPFGIPDFAPATNCLYFGAFPSPPPDDPLVDFDRKRWVFESVQVSVKQSYSFIESDVFPVYKWSGVYKYGLAYYSKDGKTNGVHTDNTMVLRTGKYKTDYEWTPEGSPVILPEAETAEIRIGHTPPPWADYYHIVRTKELSCDFSLISISSNIRKEGGYTYIDIQNILDTGVENPEVSKVLKYAAASFVEGDRVRIMHKYNSGAASVTWNNDKDALDLPIIDVKDNDGRLELKVKDIDTTSSPNIISIADGDKTVIEIYRPAKVLSDEDVVFYEIGYKYNVLSDQEGNKYHEGQRVEEDVVLASVDLTVGVPKTFFSSTKTIETFYEPTIAGWKVGDTIRVSGTASNDGVYTISSINIGFVITIGVNESVADESLSSPVTIEKITPPGIYYTYINMFNDGDYYYRARTMISSSDLTQGALFVADANFSETYISSVWGYGRPLIVDENIKEEYFPAMMRFSQSYIYGTNINNLSRFYPNNFEEADASFGDILRLKTRENFIRMFQRYKVGMIPIYRQIIVDNATSSQVALSERLLNKPNYYSGEYGIDKYGSSLVSTDYGDYFIDTNNRALIRVSIDGITNMSDTFGMMSWSNENIREDSFGLGCFNQEQRCVIMVVGRIETIQNVVAYNIITSAIGYNESRKKFESFYGFHTAEALLFVNGYIYSLKNTRVDDDEEKDAWCIWIHDSETRNNFFGEQQSSEIHTVFNGNLQLKKTYVAIEELSTDVWTGNVKTGPLTGQETTIEKPEFKKVIGGVDVYGLENKFNTTIKRAANKPGGKFFGQTMKGNYAALELSNDSSSEQRLISVSLKYVQSPLTNI